MYLIHFKTRYRHAGHYLGFCEDLDKRIAQHRAGNGARLMAVIAGAGIGWKVVKVWRGDRAFERRLKRRKNAPRRLCPVCRGQVDYDQADDSWVLPTESKPPIPSPLPVPVECHTDDDPPF
jgi:predicted GIY-YIG superfamily endonuclease